MPRLSLPQTSPASTAPAPPVLWAAPASAVAPGKAARASDCASAVIDVMPVVMDAMRVAMRLQIGEPMSVPQFRCLKFIARNPGTSISGVAGFLGVTLPTASVMVDRLVRAGAVAPGTAQADRRRSELQVTAAGSRQVRQIEDGAREEFSRALGGCSADELHTLRAGLAVLQRAFQPA